MTCLFNSLGSKIGHYMTFTFTLFFLQAGIRITTTFTCSSVRVAVHFHYYLVNSPERRITNYITFAFASFIPQEVKMQSFVAAW